MCLKPQDADTCTAPSAAQVHVSYFYDSRGNLSEHEIVVKDDTMRWKGEITGCTAVFTENGKVQTANHVRLDENGEWVPSMKVVLRKVE